VNNHVSEYGVVSISTQTVTPPNQKSYLIQPGDTLTSIAAKFSMTIQDLAKLNEIANPDLIIAGQTLLIG
jgi:spore germination protein